MADEKNEKLTVPPLDNDATVLQKNQNHDATVLQKHQNSLDPVPGLTDEVLTPNYDSSAQSITTVAQSEINTSEARRSIDIGSVINNRFIMDELLGSGGMGVVYRALDKRKQEAQDRDPYVAIKLLGEEFKRYPQAFVALERETRKTQTLAHPNIITVYDFDRDGDIVYMTMEELNGTALDDFIKEHPYGIPIKVARKIIKGLTEGLAYAHSKKIIHSDLKPSNVFITNDGTVKILDFGIARAVSNVNDSTGDKTLFDAGQLGGLTPTYASAEMMLGEAPHTSDDIYALGLMSYELLTGSHPYQRKPANIALKEGRKPKRIKGLKSHQWRTIASAIELQRSNRISSADQFLKKFEGVSKTTKALVISLITVIITLGSIAIFQPPKVGPDIAFESLPTDLQANITQALNDGAEALQFGDYNGALHYFNLAYELHPKNPDAIEGLNTVVNKVLTPINSNADADLAQNQLRQINTLLEYPALSYHQQLLQSKENLEKILSE